MEQFKSRLDIDRRETLIVQLKTENYELIQKQANYDLKVKDFEKLKLQYLDIEHNFKLLEQEKYKADREAKERDAGYQKKITNMDEDYKKLNELLAAKHQQLKETESELLKAKEVINEKSTEIIVLRAQFETNKEETLKHTEERKSMEKEYNGIIEARKSMQVELDRVITLNDRLTKANKESIDKERERSVENGSQEKHIDELNTEIEMVRKDFEQKLKELEIVKESKKATQKDLDKATITITKLQEELSRVGDNSKDLDEDRTSLNKRLNETIEILGCKEDEIKALQKSLNAYEERMMDGDNISVKLGQDYDLLKLSFDRCEEELIRQKQLMTDEVSLRRQLESENKRLERELISRDMEVKSSKKESDKVTVNKLLEDRYQLTQECEALREHASILQTQNQSVRYIIINQLATSRTR